MTYVAGVRPTCGTGSALRDCASGYTAAMVGLGAYLIDSPVATDEEEAVEWYRRAIKTGDPAGMHNLANAYANGSGLAKDEK